MTRARGPRRPVTVAGRRHREAIRHEPVEQPAGVLGEVGGIEAGEAAE